VRLIKSEFQAWLENKAKRNPYELFAKANNCAMCPIAVYLTRKFRVQRVRVGGSGVNWGFGSRPYKTTMALPPWAREFIRTIDKKMGSEMITVKHALEIARLMQ